MTELGRMLFTDGKVAGKIEGKIEVAKNLIAENIPVPLIAKTTGLTEVEILDLQKHSK